ncbi:MAG: hypothetical protein XXXJIFNMEKO3_03129 [Candidatus Erwinia impunctatus]|nr:hypothetical protein XXXJIFNMEKO_03129 [Culicoides impunctatus]
MSELLIPVVGMLVFVFGEAVILQLTGRQRVNWHEVIFNLNSGHIVLWLFRCVEVLCYGVIASQFSLHVFDEISPVWVWLFALLAWDFGFYWLHRFHHQLRLLWAVHVVHHQGEHFNLSLGVRNSWYSSLTSIPFFMVLAGLGVPLSVFLTVSVLHYTVQFLNHNALTPKLGWLEYLFVTPTHHRVHHLNERRFADTNYGGTFIFWDKLFGTFCRLPLPHQHTYGVSGSQPSANLLRESNLPFLRLAGMRRIAQPRQPRFHCAPWMVVSGALLLFMLVLGYIQRYGYVIDTVSHQQMVLFLLLTAGTITLGAVSDGARWGIAGWCLVTSLLPLTFLVGWEWQHPFWYLFLSLIALHGVVLATGAGWRIRGKKHESV